MAGKFRYTHFDPLLTVSQIFTIQSTLYFSLCSLVWMVDLVFSHHPTLGHIFSYNIVGLTRGFTFATTLCFVVNAIVGSLLIWRLVGRAKQCLDYSVTVYIIHLLFCWIYNRSFPYTISWWLLQFICASIMCVLGEYLCMRSEMKAIPLLQSGSSKDDV